MGEKWEPLPPNSNLIIIAKENLDVTIDNVPLSQVCETYPMGSLNFP